MELQFYKKEMRNRAWIHDSNKRFLLVLPRKRPEGSRAHLSSYSLHAGGSFVGLMWPRCTANLSHSSS